MCSGHFAVALLAKRGEPQLSLGAATFAAMVADLLCFVFLIAGIESFAPSPA